MRSLHEVSRTRDRRSQASEQRLPHTSKYSRKHTENFQQSTCLVTIARGQIATEDLAPAVTGPTHIRTACGKDTEERTANEQLTKEDNSSY